MPNRVVINDTYQNDVLKSLTFTLDTLQYASGDLLADNQEIALVGRENGAIVTLDSLTLLDKDNQKAALFVVFLTANTSLGTENSAPNISAANIGAKVIGILAVATADYTSIGSNGAVASIRNIGLRMQLDSANTSIFVGLVNSTGTPTYTASGLIGLFGFRRS